MSSKSSLSRFALPLLAGAALSVLAACGGEPAGPAGDTTLVEDLTMVETETPAETGVDPAMAGTEDHDGDHHDEDDHGEDDHTHVHSHDDDDHAGGTPHVHGLADLAIVLDGSTLTAELISPLANFGLSESEGVISPAVTETLPRLIMLTGGGCTADTPDAAIDQSSGHTDARIQFSWTCANPADVMFASFAGFTSYPGFETVNAVYISDGAQKAAALTPSAPQFSLQ
ncbi:MAG: DUF2796 domain-containing protein [Hyphomonas sp.]